MVTCREGPVKAGPEDCSGGIINTIKVVYTEAKDSDKLAKIVVKDVYLTAKAEIEDRSIIYNVCGA